MEAMAVGVPVVTTSIGGIGELVVDGTTGFIVPPRDAASVVRALEWILYTDPESKLPDIRRSARARIEEDFNSRREAEKLLEFISEVSAR
jgi:glycosyltransferase involved in cell wall biosynthesis